MIKRSLHYHLYVNYLKVTTHYNEYSLSKICGDVSKFYIEIGLGDCLVKEILKLLQKHVVFDNITHYCMWYLKNLDSYSRSSSQAELRKYRTK